MNNAVSKNKNAFEALIARHCGPALAAIKPGNLVACYKEKFPNLKYEIKELGNELKSKDIYFEILCECEKRALILVYRKNLLIKNLKSAEISNLLSAFGYKKCKNLDDYLRILKTRLGLNAKSEEFPHEIGAFLGYPAHDIYGFIKHREIGCLLVGEWRVYADKENAESLFRRYKACRCAILKRLERGNTLAQIFCAA